MPDFVELLRFGFPGLACALLILAYNLSNKIIGMTDDVEKIVAKKTAVYFYGGLCVVALVLSITVEILHAQSKPMPVNAFGHFSQDEFSSRKVELTFFVTTPTATPTSVELSGEPKGVTIPSNATMVEVTIPPLSELPKLPEPNNPN